MFTPDEEKRYLRQIPLPGWGWEAQEKLKKSSLLVVGAGALGCASLPYLVNAGVGKITLIDGDRIEISNLHRQPLYTTDEIGQLKVNVAKKKLSTLNPHVEIEAIPHFFTQENGGRLLTCDLLIDATDTFLARLDIDVLCHQKNIPWIHASLEQFMGQVIFFHRQLYTDLFPGLEQHTTVSCSEGGILGPFAGTIGSFQALLALQWLGGLGADLPGKCFRIDALTWRMQVFTFTQNEKDTISHFELSQWMEENRDFLLVDIRNDEEIKGGDLDGVRIGAIVAWPKEKKIILYCQRGIRSHAMAKRLRQQGIAAYSLEGGFVAHNRTQ